MNNTQAKEKNSIFPIKKESYMNYSLQLLAEGLNYTEYSFNKNNNSTEYSRDQSANSFNANKLNNTRTNSSKEFSSSKIIQVTFESFLEMSDNYYSYIKFWNQFDLSISSSKLSFRICLFLLLMLTFPLIKPYFLFVYYSIKLIILLLIYIYCGFFNKKSKYFSKDRVYRQTFKKYIPANYYLSKSEKSLSILNLIIYNTFLLSSILFLIYFLIDLKNKNTELTNIKDARIEVIVFKTISTYFQFFIEIYVILYYLIDYSNDNSLLNIYKNTNARSENENENIDIPINKFDYKECKYNPLRKKLFYSFNITASFIIMILVFSFIIAIINQDTYNGFVENDTYFYLFSFVCVMKNLLFMILYGLALKKLYSIVRFKLNWNNFLILKIIRYLDNNKIVRKIRQYYDDRYIISMSVQKNDEMWEVKERNSINLCSNISNDKISIDNLNSLNNNRNTKDPNLVLLKFEKKYISKKLSSTKGYNSLESTNANSKVIDQLKANVYVKNTNNICNIIPYIMFYDINNYNRNNKQEIPEFYNTRSKFFYIKYIKYLSFPFAFFVYTAMFISTSFSIFYYVFTSSYDFYFSEYMYLYYRLLGCLQCALLFFNTWVVYMKLEWGNLWLSD